MVAIVIVLEGTDALTKDAAQKLADEMKIKFGNLVTKNPLLCHVIKQIMVGVD